MNYKIKDVCEVTSSRRIFAREYKTSGIPFFRSQEIIELSTKGKTIPTIYISNDRYNELLTRGLNVPTKGDILISAIGANRGYPWNVSFDGFYFKDGNVIWLRNFSNQCDSKYLTYALSTNKYISMLQTASEHSAQGAITLDLIKNIEIHIPPIEKQQHIVNTIGSIDDLIENYNDQIAKICNILSTTLNKYNEITYISYYEPEIIKSGINTFDKEKIYLDTSSINGINNLSNGEVITYSKRPSRANMQPINNSVWFAKMKGSEKILLLTENDNDIVNNNILSTGFLGIKASGKFPLSLLFSIIISNNFKIQRDLNSVGTTMAGINNETFVKILVPKLSEEEIKYYDQKYKYLVMKLSYLRRQIKLLNDVKQNLLSKYF
ncbi:MAG: restriction endonuclease subunit S [Candidatus Faecimonas sp.]|nr:restriction endonuclease subunit S [Mycoplasmatota bacterium]MDY2908270.1 restriction endonuclease subunit S [Candidatus Faecimonas sp.]